MAEPIALAAIADTLAGLSPSTRLLVAVDGADGTGKTTFTAALADAIEARGRAAAVVHVDGYLLLRSVRHRRGRASPVGYLDDSYDYPALIREVLEPLSAAGSGWYRPAVVDHRRDVRVTPQRQYAAARSVVLVEGLFLHRDELIGWWDRSVLLELDPAVALSRKAERDGMELPEGSELANRYVEGQRLYRSRYAPAERASWIIRPVGFGSAPFVVGVTARQTEEQR
jgi:uridine kinase